MLIIPRATILPAILAVTACTLVGYPVGAPATPAPAAARATSERAAADTSSEAPGRAEPDPDGRGAPDFRRDRPPTVPRDVDLDTISDAVPREEPLAATGNMPEYEVLGTVYRVLGSPEGYEDEGMASWYGEEFQGRRTSSGEPYDMYAMTAAHPTLPIPSYAQVTNVQNGRSVVVRINDRGPFLRDRVIDLSYAGAWKLGYIQSGHAQVDVRAVVPGEARVVAGAQPAARAVPASAQVAAGAVSTSAPSGNVYLQLGAFAAEASAESMRERLQRQLDWVSERIEVLASDALYKLQLGPYRSRDDATGMAERLAQELNFRPFLVVR